MATDTAELSLFEQLDGIDVGPDAPPIVDQLRAEVAQDFAAAGNATDTPEFVAAVRKAIGSYVSRKGWRIEQVVEQREVQRAALIETIEQLTARLNAAKATLQQVDADIEHDTEHDRMALAQIGEYLFSKARRKSLHFGTCVLGTRASSRKEAPEVLDRDALAALLPQYTRPTLDWAAAKKDLIVRDGCAYTPDGEAIPAEVVSVRAGEKSVKPFIKLFGGPRLDLYEGVRTDGDGDSDTTANPYGPDDPFADTAPDGGFGGAFDD